MTNEQFVHYIGTEGWSTILEHGFSEPPDDPKTRLLWLAVQDAHKKQKDAIEAITKHLEGRR